MFFNRSVTVLRQAAGHYGSDGIWVAPVSVELTFYTSVQPVSPDDMALLPEGRRDQEAFALYTRRRINTAQGDTNADRVEIDGRTYECLISESWQNGLIPHFRSVVVLEGEP